jgi:hypothetical protein
MALPISIGDAILLSQIAYNLGVALTSGRKAASAEFSEIQGLLYTLSGALKLLVRDLPEEESSRADQSSKLRDEEMDSLLQMIKSCQGTLRQLENLVSKYRDIDAGLNLQRPGRRWMEEARINWTKVLWAKERDEIAKIKVSLATHINGVNLAVGAINK